MKLNAPIELVCDVAHHYAASNGQIYHTDDLPDEKAKWGRCPLLDDAEW